MRFKLHLTFSCALAILTSIAIAMSQGMEGAGLSAEASTLDALGQSSRLSRALQNDDAAKQFVAEFANQPLYIKETTAAQLLLAIKRAASGESEASPEHMLHLLASGFDLPLPLLQTDAEPEEVLSAHREASALIDAYFAGVRNARRELHRNLPSTDSLSDQYSDKFSQFSAGELDYTMEALPMFEDMLIEWYPIGKKVADLERVVGRSARKGQAQSGKSDVAILYYRFFHEWSGAKVNFAVRDGVIKAVRLEKGAG